MDVFSLAAILVEQNLGGLVMACLCCELTLVGTVHLVLPISPPWFTCLATTWLALDYMIVSGFMLHSDLSEYLSRLVNVYTV